MAAERYAVIGDRIDHSLSPAMQNAAFRAAGIDAVYRALRVPPSEMESTLARFRRGDLDGFNVTIPHKRAVCVLVDRLAPTAQIVGAVNTVVVEPGTLVGYNTDVEGFRDALQDARVSIRGERALVFGTGGAARAVLYALMLEGARPIVVSRASRRARELADEIPGNVEPLCSADPALKVQAERAALVVNATPLGMAGLSALSPLPQNVELSPPTMAFDLVYGRQTPFLEHAAANGCTAIDGIEMLVCQGAASFRLWTGREPDIEVMRAACKQALHEVQLCSPS